MRQWVRRPMPEKCGRCGELVPKDTPLLLIDPDESRLIKHRFIRCRSCAGEPVPENVPAYEPRRLTMPVRLADIPGFDFKAAQMAKERE